MLHREDSDGVIVISQPAHAWVAAQLGRQWGNPRFGAFAPWEEVCLAAEQHDTGSAGWEGAPTVNPGTGRPHTFIDLPGDRHTAIVATASRTVLTQNCYAALLVSLLFTDVWEKYYTGPELAGYADQVRAFLKQERDLQALLSHQLQTDPVYSAHVAPATVARNLRLVMLWDAMSLALCAGGTAPQVFEAVPAADGEVTLTLTPSQIDRRQVRVAPWPYRSDQVSLTVEGRRLASACHSDADLRAALASADWLTLQWELRPG